MNKMKDFFLLVCLCLCFFVAAGQTDTTNPPAQPDTTVTLEPFTDPVITDEDAKRNIDNIVALQKERNDKQKKGAVIRIAIGVGLLVILVIGLLRRKKLKSN